MAPWAAEGVAPTPEHPHVAGRALAAGYCCMGFCQNSGRVQGSIV